MLIILYYVRSKIKKRRRRRKRRRTRTYGALALGFRAFILVRFGERERALSQDFNLTN